MPSSRGSNPHLLCLLHWQVGSSPPASATWEAPSVHVLLNLTSLVRTHAFPICSKKEEEHVFKGCSLTLQFTRKRFEDGLKFKSTRPHSGSWWTIQWSRGPAPTSCSYLGGDGGKAATEVHMLVHLAAVGRQEPGPKGLVFTSRLVAVTLVGQELRQVPAVRRCGPNQRNEDGFRGHVELKEKTHRTI